MHCPTARAAEVVLTTWVKVAVDEAVTVLVVVALVVGLVSWTVMAEPLTAVTRPLTPPKPAAPAKLRPVGRLAFLAVEPLEVEPPVAVGRLPPKPPKPPALPPKPVVQAPETGWVIRTVVTVVGVDEAAAVVVVVVLPAFLDPFELLEPVEDLEVFGALGGVAGAPKAVTHDPTVTLASVPVWDCSNVVVPV